MSARFKRHGAFGTSLYFVWASMKRRCNPAAASRYPRYGGRGINVCAEWASDFLAFESWAKANGYAPGLAIDRIDNDGNYEPGNCRWVTARENCRNTSKTRIVEAFGERKSVAAWAEDARCNAKYFTVMRRLALGWPAEKAITQAAPCS